MQSPRRSPPVEAAAAALDGLADAPRARIAAARLAPDDAQAVGMRRWRWRVADDPLAARARADRARRR